MTGTQDSAMNIESVTPPWPNCGDCPDWKGDRCDIWDSVRFCPKNVGEPPAPHKAYPRVECPFCKEWDTSVKLCTIGESFCLFEIQEKAMALDAAWVEKYFPWFKYLQDHGLMDEWHPSYEKKEG